MTDELPRTDGTADAAGGDALPAAGQPLLRIEGVAKTFGTFRAVDGVSLDIKAGEFFALLGPSGCGKTTLLRMLAGFEAPDEGRILLGDKDIAQALPHERPINMMFQNYALFPHLSVRDNIAFGLKRAGMARTEIATRVAEMVALVKLEGLEKRKPDQLSGGQRQRVALARAMVNHPQVLLLDEPLGALDLKLRQEMQVELKQIQQEVGITFVYVTHDQEEALTMSDRIAVFNEGRIEQVSPPRELYEHPANEFVAGFVGVSNVIERGGARQTIRPEKIEMLEAGVSPPEGLHTERGRLVGAAYAGSVTRYTVALEEGGELQIVRQNVEAAPGRAPSQGDEVLVGWRPEHAAAIQGTQTKEEVAR